MNQPQCKLEVRKGILLMHFCTQPLAENSNIFKFWGFLKCWADFRGGGQFNKMLGHLTVTHTLHEFFCIITEATVLWPLYRSVCVTRWCYTIELPQCLLVDGDVCPWRLFASHLSMKYFLHLKVLH